MKFTSKQKRSWPGIAVLYSGVAILAVSFIVSCTSINVYEKSVSMPDHAWKSSNKPTFNFAIEDTTAAYNVFLVLRHTEKYNFNNIFINLSIQGPGKDTAIKFQKDLLLATNEKGWLGTGMDDIYEHRVLMGVLGEGGPLTAGDYNFVIEQIMREDPLEHILNVGLRVEKKQ
jgi:gliding motility-associated lipoprotein GldH